MKQSSGGKTTFFLLLPSLVLTVVFVLTPVLGIGVFSFLEVKSYRFQPSLTLENFADLFTLGAWKFTLSTLVETLAMAGLVLSMVVAGAFPVAYFLARKVKSETIKTVLLVMCILPFWTSYIIRMITWVPVLAQNGLVNNLLMELHIIDTPIRNLLFSFKAMIIVEFFLWVVFMIGPIFWALARIPDEVMEASLNLGATRIKRFLTITLPMSVPGLATGVMIVFVMFMSDFATPRIIGGGHYFLFSSFVNNSMQNSDFALAAAYSTVLTLVTLLFVYLLFRAIDLRKEL